MPAEVVSAKDLINLLIDFDTAALAKYMATYN